MIKTFTKNDSYDDLIYNNDFIIFEFSLPNCTRCKTLHQNLDQVEEDVAIYDIDIVDNSNLVRKLNVYAGPCLMIYYQGSLVYRNLGLFDFNEVKAVIEKYNK